MTETPRPVVLYIPLMKELGLTWSEIKSMPAWELEGLQAALNEYRILHSMDGYTDKDISEMAKNKPQVRSDYYKYMELKSQYEERLGLQRKAQSFAGIVD